MYGVYLGFLLPLSTLAASVARRPRVLPLASTTNHLRSISCALGMYVDIFSISSKKLAFKTQFAAQITARIQKLTHDGTSFTREVGAGSTDWGFPGSAPSQSARWSQTYGQ